MRRLGKKVFHFDYIGSLCKMHSGTNMPRKLPSSRLFLRISVPPISFDVLRLEEPAIKICLKMNSLALLKAYGSSDSEDEPVTFVPASVPAREPEAVTYDVSSRQDETLDRFSEHENSANGENAETYDSDGSFFGSGIPRKRKMTKKMIKTETSLKKRRESHGIILQNCQCRRKCADLLSRDDKLKVHETYWNLDVADQRSFVRKYVHLAPVESRHKNRKVSTDLRKKHSYTFSIPSACDVPVPACRKFFLNTIGFGEHCG